MQRVDHWAVIDANATAFVHGCAACRNRKGDQQGTRGYTSDIQPLLHLAQTARTCWSYGGCSNEMSRVGAPSTSSSMWCEKGIAICTFRGNQSGHRCCRVTGVPPQNRQLRG